MPFQKGNKLGKVNKGRKILPWMGFQKGHSFYGDLTKPNHFQKGHLKPKNAYKWPKGHPLLSKGTLGKHWKLSKEQRIKLGENRKGEKSGGWKNGVSPENEKIRKNIQSRLWRESVFARDNWTCQKCKERGGKLHSHHIKNFSQYPKLRFAIDNGITFCKKCHAEFHKRYGKQNNTKEQLEEFLNI